MHTCIVWTRADGGVTVQCPADRYVASFPTEAEGIAAVIAKDIPLDRQHTAVVCTHDDLPSTRRFRNCWRRPTARVVVDLPLAREQRLEELRRDRTPRLAKSDIDVVRALEDPSSARVGLLRTYRQALRDLPATSHLGLAACPTADALAAWEPAWPVDPA